MNRHIQAYLPAGWNGLTIPIDVTWSAATSVAMNASWQSDEILIPTRYGFGIDASWDGTGSPIGEIFAEVSNGNSWNTFSEWIALVDTIAGSSGWDIDSNFYKCRLRYVRTSGGAGAICTAKFFTKG